MPAELPDLKDHSNFLTDVLKKNPELYKQLKDKKTKLGVTLGHCIKTGIDNKGSSLFARVKSNRLNFRSPHDQDLWPCCWR
jgi:creatine kinase